MGFLFFFSFIFWGGLVVLKTKYLKISLTNFDVYQQHPGALLIEF